MSETTHSEEHAGHHIVSPKLYIINAIVIAILMVATVLAAKLDLPGGINGLGLALALFIAVLKAGCIISIFMGVWWSKPIVQMFALAVIGWLIILFAFTLIDVASPDWGLGTPYLDVEAPGSNPLHH